MFYAEENMKWRNRREETSIQTGTAEKVRATETVYLASREILF